MTARYTFAFKIDPSIRTRTLNVIIAKPNTEDHSDLISTVFSFHFSICSFFRHFVTQRN
jgi:ribulose bisphosphate carboxylase small subunit